MACSAHLLSQSLYSSHRASPAARGNLRSGARASPAARPGSSVRGCRGVSLTVAASFEQGRRQVEVRALLNSQLCAGTARFGKGCSDCGRKLGRTVSVRRSARNGELGEGFRFSADSIHSPRLFIPPLTTQPSPRRFQYANAHRWLLAVAEASVSSLPCSVVPHSGLWSGWQPEHMDVFCNHFSAATKPVYAISCPAVCFYLAVPFF